ncbi:hypothetical protein K438DRAFT_1762291 [Mycena galopus ATCC 62051]|nr:hypothetical protein K438DRAFT_1762291 [Mycena galopus ATCC 62051]
MMEVTGELAEAVMSGVVEHAEGAREVTWAWDNGSVVSMGQALNPIPTQGEGYLQGTEIGRNTNLHARDTNGPGLIKSELKTQWQQIFSNAFSWHGVNKSTMDAIECVIKSSKRNRVAGSGDKTVFKINVNNATVMDHKEDPCLKSVWDGGGVHESGKLIARILECFAVNNALKEDTIFREEQQQQQHEVLTNILNVAGGSFPMDVDRAPSPLSHLPVAPYSTSRVPSFMGSGKVLAPVDAIQCGLRRRRG